MRARTSSTAVLLLALVSLTGCSMLPDPIRIDLTASKVKWMRVSELPPHVQEAIARDNAAEMATPNTRRFEYRSAARHYRIYWYHQADGERYWWNCVDVDQRGLVSRMRGDRIMP